MRRAGGRKKNATQIDREKGTYGDEGALLLPGSSGFLFFFFFSRPVVVARAWCWMGQRAGCFLRNLKGEAHSAPLPPPFSASRSSLLFSGRLPKKEPIPLFPLLSQRGAVRSAWDNQSSGEE